MLWCIQDWETSFPRKIIPLCGRPSELSIYGLARPYLIYARLPWMPPSGQSVFPLTNTNIFLRSSSSQRPNRSPSGLPESPKSVQVTLLEHHHRPSSSTDGRHHLVQLSIALSLLLLLLLLSARIKAGDNVCRYYEMLMVAHRMGCGSARRDFPAHCGGMGAVGHYVMMDGWVHARLMFWFVSLIMTG